jgi:hypothetical protein
MTVFKRAVALAAVILLSSPALTRAGSGGNDPGEAQIKKPDLVGKMVTDFGPTPLGIDGTTAAEQAELVVSLVPAKSRKDAISENFVHVLSCPTFADPAAVPICPDDPFGGGANVDPACLGSCLDTGGFQICNDFEVNGTRVLLVDDAFRGAFGPCTVNALTPAILARPSLGLDPNAALNTQAFEDGNALVQPFGIFLVFKLLIEAL